MEETIGQRINVVRKKLNLTLEKFGEKIGISKVSVRAIEKGINNPSEQTIKLICSVYNVDYVWLTKGIGNEMFVSIPESKIDQIMEDYGLTEAPEEVRQQVADYLNSIVEREIARREKEKSNKK